MRSITPVAHKQIVYSLETGTPACARIEIFSTSDEMVSLPSGFDCVYPKLRRTTGGVRTETLHGLTDEELREISWSLRCDGKFRFNYVDNRFVCR